MIVAVVRIEMPPDLKQQEAVEPFQVSACR